MHPLRRLLLSAALALPWWLAGCASTSAPVPSTAAAVDAPARTALAPTGSLRVGVYPGSPTSLVLQKTGERAGVAYELGGLLGQRLGVPVRIVEFSRVAQVLDALKAGTVDVTFTNATELRARDVDFSAPLVRLELGYLVPPASPITAVAEVDRPGVRVGVSEGSSSQGTLGRLYQHAVIVPAASLRQAQELLAQQRIDAFATNKGILFELSDSLPGYRVLDGRWGFENLAIAVPKGREAGAVALRQFVQDLRNSAALQGMVQRAGLRGVAAGE